MVEVRLRMLLGVLEGVATLTGVLGAGSSTMRIEVSFIGAVSSMVAITVVGVLEEVEEELDVRNNMVNYYY